MYTTLNQLYEYEQCYHPTKREINTYLYFLTYPRINHTSPDPQIEIHRIFQKLSIGKNINTLTKTHTPLSNNIFT